MVPPLELQTELFGLHFSSILLARLEGVVVVLFVSLLQLVLVMLMHLELNNETLRHRPVWLLLSSLISMQSDYLH